MVFAELQWSVATTLQLRSVATTSPASELDSNSSHPFDEIHQAAQGFRLGVMLSKFYSRLRELLSE